MKPLTRLIIVLTQAVSPLAAFAQSPVLLRTGDTTNLGGQPRGGPRQDKQRNMQK